MAFYLLYIRYIKEYFCLSYKFSLFQERGRSRVAGRAASRSLPGVTSSPATSEPIRGRKISFARCAIKGLWDQTTWGKLSILLLYLRNRVPASYWPLGHWCRLYWLDWLQLSRVLLYLYPLLSSLLLAERLRTKVTFTLNKNFRLCYPLTPIL